MTVLHRNSSFGVKKSKLSRLMIIEVSRCVWCKMKEKDTTERFKFHSRGAEISVLEYYDNLIC